MAHASIASLVDKKKDDEEPQVLLAKQIIAKVGEFSSVGGVEEVIANIPQLAALLVDVGDLKIFPNEISDIFVRCMSSLPVQSTVVSTVLSLVFKRDANFPMIVKDKIETKLLQSLAANDVLQTKLILRSIAALACCKCLDADSLSATIGVLIDKVEQSYPAAKKGKGKGRKSTSAEDSGSAFTSDSMVPLYLVASTVPWAAEVLSESIKERCTALFTKFLSEYQSTFDVGGKQALFQVYACPLDDNGDETTPATLGALSAEGPESSACWDTLWESVLFANAVCGGSKGLPDSMLRPWMYLQDGLSEEVSGAMWDDSERPQVLSLGAEFGAQLGGLAFDANKDMSAWLTPIFPLFDKDSSEAAASCGSSLSGDERQNIMQYFRDIVHFFDPVIGEDGTYTGTMQLMINHVWAVSKQLPAEKKEAVLAAEGALPTLLIETLVQMIPVGRGNNAKLSRLLLELCKTGGETHVRALGQAVNLLFAMVDELDFSASQAVAAWLATHLVNTQLTWPYWVQWANTIKEENGGALRGPRAFFCKSVIDSLSRRALPQNVFPTLMGVSDFEASLQQEGDAEPVLKLPGSISGPDDELWSALKHKIDVREESEQVEGMLEAHVDGAILLMQVLLKTSGNIPSAFTSLIERYGGLIRTLPVEGDEEAIVRSLADSTSHDGGLFSSFLDICLRRAVISGTSAMAFLCSDHVLSTINDNIWVTRLVLGVVERSLDIVRAALVQYLDSGGVFPFDFDAVVSLIQKEEEGNEGDEMQDDSNYAAKALGAAILGAQRIHVTLVTSLVKHAAEAGDADMGVEASIVAAACRLYASATASCAQVASSNGGGLGFEITGDVEIAKALGKKFDGATAAKAYRRF